MKIKDNITAKINVNWERAVHAAIGSTVIIWGIPYWIYRLSAGIGVLTTESWNIEVKINTQGDNNYEH